MNTLLVLLFVYICIVVGSIVSFEYYNELITINHQLMHTVHCAEHFYVYNPIQKELRDKERTFSFNLRTNYLIFAPIRSNVVINWFDCLFNPLIAYYYYSIKRNVKAINFASLNQV
jgi:hypothetical protein